MICQYFNCNRDRPYDLMTFTHETDEVIMGCSESLLLNQNYLLFCEGGGVYNSFLRQMEEIVQHYTYILVVEVRPLNRSADTNDNWFPLNL